MPLITYVGTAHYRILDAADAKRAEPPIEGFKKTVWSRGESQEVADGVAEWMLRDLGDEFVQAKSETRTLAATAKAADTTAGAEAGGGGDAPAGRVSKSSTSGASTTSKSS